MAIWHPLTRLSVLFLLCLLPSRASSASAPLTIVTLAPHLTEWVYSLEQQHQLLAVSDYSDYPPAAKHLPRVADYQGADIKAIVKLQPDIVLAWQGGNRAQDLSRLEQLGLQVFRSHPQYPEDITNELLQLAELLQVSPAAKANIINFAADLRHLRQRYSAVTPPVEVFYYSATTPLLTVGANSWANRLLGVCGARTLFYDAPNDYPQVSVKAVLQRQPQALVAAMHSQDNAHLNAFWLPHRPFLTAPLVAVNPDIMSRFTLRLLPTLSELCEQIHIATASTSREG